MIRAAVKEDIDQILELGREFGHLMKFHQQEETLLPHIDNIIVEEDSDQDTKGILIGYYHIQPIDTYEDLEFVVKEKTFPILLQDALEQALNHSSLGSLAVLMQGASHREVFRTFIEFYQESFIELWSWCSIKSNRPQSYKELGFSYNPKVEYTFPNPHKDGEHSTYQLGIWTRSEV